MNQENYVFVAPGKAFMPSGHRTVLFRFVSEAAQAILDTGYPQVNGFVSHRAAISGSSRGYFAGGSSSSSQRLVVIDFISELHASRPEYLSIRHPRSLGAQSESHGFMFGGTPDEDDKQGTLVSKLSFIDESVSAAGELSQPSGSYTRYLWKQAASGFDYAYLRSDMDCETPDHWSLYEYVTGTHTLVGQAAALQQQRAMPLTQSETAAYVPLSPSNAIERFDFATQASAVMALSLLPEGVSSQAAASSASKGYFPSSNGTTYGMLFVSETSVAVYAALQGTVGSSINSLI